MLIYTYFFALVIQSLLAVLDTCKTFQEFSSFKINQEKCQACWISAAEDKSVTPTGSVSTIIKSH